MLHIICKKYVSVFLQNILLFGFYYWYIFVSVPQVCQADTPMSCLGLILAMTPWKVLTGREFPSTPQLRVPGSAQPPLIIW